MTLSKPRSEHNRTLTLTDAERAELTPLLLRPKRPLSADELNNRILQGDMTKLLRFLPDGFVDLLILDPPYNLDKKFNGKRFSRMTAEEYLAYLESWFPNLLRLLKPTASVYLCGDWSCSAADFFVLSKYLHVRNRIVWQREKGRGALANWKNGCEDIWFATAGARYHFDSAAVKLRRKVIAPYREAGRPKDWEETPDGRFRATFPSNFWDDVSVPYWSMPENTDHPTQKPEKLLAKLILASSKPGDFVFDPFLGSGTTAAVARKLGRNFAGIEREKEYCLWALERLRRAERDASIQGYCDGVFWERNSFSLQKKVKRVSTPKPEN